MMRREAMTVAEQRHYRDLGRSTAPWYIRWWLWLVQRGAEEAGT